MYVALDSNILLQDPWLESRRTAALFAFADQTQGKVLIHDVVLMEVRAELRRRWSQLLADAAGVHRQASRLRVRIGEPPQPDACLQDVQDRWDAHFEAFQPYLRRLVSTDPRLLEEVLARATGRIPPCARSGEEIRDALLWLGVLGHCRDKGWSELAFISANRRDFADADGQLLQRLAADGHEHGLTLTFYTSVDDFLKEHALPIEHINVPWVNERLSEEEVIRRLDSAFEDEDWEDFIPWSERGEGWRPYGPPAEDQVYPQLEGVYVWGRSGESIQVLLDYYVQVLRNLPCEREVGDPVVGYWHETRDFDGSLERIAHVSARISGDNIEILDVEGIERA